MTQCTAKAKSTGEQCQNDAIKGGKVCRVHGGGAPQVKKKAAERLREAALPAIHDLDETRKEVRGLLEEVSSGIEAAELIRRVEENEDASPEALVYLLMGLSKHHKGLVADILDRAGYPKTKRQELTGSDGGALSVKLYGFDPANYPDGDESND